MWQSSLVAWPLSCSHSTNAWTSCSKTASEGSTWRGWLADHLSTLHPVRRRRRQEPCPSMGEWSLARDPSRNGHEVFQDLWHFKCFGWDRRRQALQWGGQEIDDDEDNEFRLRAKARVTQMASKLYCQLKALYKTVPLGATDSIKVKWPTVLFVSLVCCVLLLGTWLRANFEICVTFPLVLTSEKK